MYEICYINTERKGVSREWEVGVYGSRQGVASARVGSGGSRNVGVVVEDEQVVGASGITWRGTCRISCDCSKAFGERAWPCWQNSTRQVTAESRVASAEPVPSVPARHRRPFWIEIHSSIGAHKTPRVVHMDLQKTTRRAALSTRRRASTRAESRGLAHDP